MLHFDSYRKLRNGKSYKTNSRNTLSENGSTEDNKADISTENTK